MSTASPDPKLVFEGLFRTLVRSIPEKAREVDGVVLFTVVGQRGGEYTFDLRRGGQPDVQAGRTTEPDLHIVIEEHFFGDFLVGDYVFADAVRTSKLGVVGKKKVYDALVRFLRPRPVKKKDSPGRAELKGPSARGVRLGARKSKKRR